jgi:plasmid stabilization system protein ParE
MLVIWNDEALTEANAATLYYREKQAELGQRFVDAVEDAAAKIAHRPLLYRKLAGDVRKCKLPHFPFGIVYSVREEAIYIIAVMHMRQEPGYWKHRVKS